MSVLLFSEAFAITTTASLTSWFLLYFCSRVRRQAPISRMLLLQQLLLLSVLQHPVSCRLVKPGSVAQVRVSICNAKSMAVNYGQQRQKKNIVVLNMDLSHLFVSSLSLFFCVSVCLCFLYFCAQFDVVKQLNRH